MIKWILFITLPILTIAASAQELTGTVRDGNGEPIPAATIFIKELSTGITSNDQGNYHIHLPRGTYHIAFQSLGYQTQQITIEITTQPIRQDVVLHQQPVVIKEVRIYAGKEDPAYAIMRKTIALAPRNLKAVESFRSEVYIKGSLLVKKIPRLIANKIEVNHTKIKAGDQFTLESLNEISFRAPDQYEHTVVSTRSTFPQADNNRDQYIGYINSSFYQPNIGTTISPLAPSAFSHYRFVYEGYFLQQGYEINQIRVIPRRKSKQLFEGHLYIEEKTHQLQSVDLTNEAFFGKIRIRQTFAPVKEETWLPVNHNFKIEAAMMGVQADASYVGAVKYKSVEINNLIAAATISTQKQNLSRDNIIKEQKSETNRIKIEELLSKPDLNNRDMAKAIRLMDKQERLLDTLAQSLEIKDNYRFIKQTDSIKRTSEDWDLLRPIPLTTEEIGSFRKKDSLMLKAMPLAGDTVRTKQKKHHLTNAIFGSKRFFVADSALNIQYDGVINPKLLSFHPATGFSYEQKIDATLKPDTLRSLNFGGMARYVFSQKRGDWHLYANYQMETGIKYGVGFSAGHFNADYKEELGVNAQLNGLYNLFFKDNYKVVTRTHQYAVNQNIEIAHGLRLTLTGEYNYYIEQENRTNYSFFEADTDYKPNIPVNPSVESLHLSTSSQALLKSRLQYTPLIKFRRYNGRRIDMGSDYPTFTLQYWQGVSSLWGSRSNYSHLQLMASQKRDWAIFHSLQWLVEAGKYFNASDLHFSQWHHFSGNTMPVGTDRWETSLSTIQPYMLSTNRWYLHFSGGYASPYLALKYLPFFSNRLWLENVYLHHVTLPHETHYTEIGYGISQIFLFARIGVFAGFHNGKCNEVVVRAGFSF